MTAIRDLKPGDVVQHEGEPRTVAEVKPGRDARGYPVVTVTFTDGSYLWKAAGHQVEAVEPGEARRARIVDDS